MLKYHIDFSQRYMFKYIMFIFHEYLKITFTLLFQFLFHINSDQYKKYL
jgi:hypothetical protein